ncbi:hypothetical protein OJAV_G00061090 [Oryzias javanicus]|uniref:Uncharacterized protein n=1 Tax=Oryzias javanicus TaxID=123683 RepID=A0A3S2N2I9_ORYJA|nr:hypothetical protein OJAV_G00061090 [Oryzias javanicus]
MVITSTNITSIPATITCSSAARSPVSARASDPPPRSAAQNNRRRHAEGSKTRRAVFLGSLISTTWPAGKPDGRCAKVPRQYVPRGRHAAPDADRRGPAGRPARARVRAPGTERQDQRNFAGEALGEPVLPLRAGDLRGETGAELGERLSAGHQEGAEALLQRGHRVSPAGPPRRRDHGGASGEPVQSDRDLHGGARGGEPLRSQESDVRRDERPREVVRNDSLPRRVQVQGEPAPQQLQRLRVSGVQRILHRAEQARPREEGQQGHDCHDCDALLTPNMTRQTGNN